MQTCLTWLIAIVLFVIFVAVAFFKAGLAVALAIAVTAAVFFLIGAGALSAIIGRVD